MFVFVLGVSNLPPFLLNFNTVPTQWYILVLFRHERWYILVLFRHEQWYILVLFRHEQWYILPFILFENIHDI
jgi:hypothetical protein